jgi:hypothetical protein
VIKLNKSIVDVLVSQTVVPPSVPAIGVLLTVISTTPVAILEHTGIPEEAILTKLYVVVEEGDTDTIAIPEVGNVTVGLGKVTPSE